MRNNFTSLENVCLDCVQFLKSFVCDECPVLHLTKKVKGYKKRHRESLFSTKDGVPLDVNQNR